MHTTPQYGAKLRSQSFIRCPLLRPRIKRTTVVEGNLANDGWDSCRGRRYWGLQRWTFHGKVRLRCILNSSGHTFCIWCIVERYMLGLDGHHRYHTCHKHSCSLFGCGSHFRIPSIRRRCHCRWPHHWGCCWT